MREDFGMWSPFPLPPNPGALDEVAEILDPVLIALGFEPGQGGASEGRGSVTFCGGMVDSIDGGCVDLFVELRATPVWRITGVHYWGFPGEKCHLEFDPDADLSGQLADLARTLPIILAHRA